MEERIFDYGFHGFHGFEERYEISKAKSAFTF
jgi:hypothetical protein